MSETTVIVVSDFDGYFEDRVRKILGDLSGPSAYEVIRVSATPWLADAVQYEIHEGELHLTFYSGLRHGFGMIDWTLVADLIRGAGKAAKATTVTDDAVVVARGPREAPAGHDGEVEDPQMHPGPGQDS